MGAHIYIILLFVIGEHRHIMQKKILLKNAVPSQNLPAASYSRGKNAVQSEKRAQRLLNRNAKQSKDNVKNDGEKSNSGIQANAKETAEPKAHPSISIRKTSVGKNKNVRLNTVHNALPHKIAKNLQSTRTKLSAKEKSQNSIFVKKEPTAQNAVSKQQNSDGKRENVNINTVHHTMNVMNLLKTRSKLNAWTGIQTFFLLHKIEERVSVIRPKVEGGNDLSVLESILLCFIRLKTKLPFICLTSLFHISTSSATKIFSAMTPFIKAALDDVNYFSSTIESNDNQPITLRMYGYNEARAIVDCTDEVQTSKCKQRICRLRHLDKLLNLFFLHCR